MTRLFRDSLESIDADLKEINRLVSGSLKEITAALKRLDKGGGRL